MLSVDVLSYNVQGQAQKRDINGLIDRIVRKRPAIVCLHNVNQSVLAQIRDSPVVDTYFVPKRPDLKPLGNLILARHKLTEIQTERFNRTRERQRDDDRAANMTTGVVYVPLEEHVRGKEEAIFVSAVTLSASSAAWRQRQNQWRDILRTLDREPRVLISVCSNCSYRGNDRLDIPDEYMLAEDKQNRDVQVVFRTENEADFRNVSYFETSQGHIGLEVSLLNDTTRFYDEATPLQPVEDEEVSPLPTRKVRGDAMIRSPSPQRRRPTRYRDERDRTPPRRRRPQRSQRSQRPQRSASRDERDYKSEEDEYGLYSDEEEADARTPESALRSGGRGYDRGRSLRVLEERDIYGPEERPRSSAPRNSRSRLDEARRGFSFDRPRDRRARRRDVMREEEIEQALQQRAQVDRVQRRGFSRRRAEEARKLDSDSLSRRVFGKRHDELGGRRDMRPIDEVRKLTESERNAVDREWKKRYGKSSKDLERIQSMDRRAFARQVIFQGDNNAEADERKYENRSSNEDMAQLRAERQRQEREFTQNLDDYYGEQRPQPRTNSSRQKAPRRRARYD